MYSPIDGMKTNRNAATMPGAAIGSVILRKRREPARAEVGRRLEQPPVDVLERDEDRAGTMNGTQA